MKKRQFCIITAVLTMAFLSGCGGAAKKEFGYATEDMAYNGKFDGAYMETAPSVAWGEREYATTIDTVTSDKVSYKPSGNNTGATEVTDKTVMEKNGESNRKVIKSASLEVQTLEFDSFIAALENKIAFYEAYKESASTSGNNIYYTSNRFANYRIRVPEDKLDEFLSAVGTIGTVISTSYNEEDITLQYVDIESRLKTLYAERDKLLQLLEEAKYVGDTIELVNRLSNVTYEIENYTSRLRTYDNKITYSTVNISVREVERVTPTVPEAPKTVWQRISIGFKDNLKDIGDGIANFFVWFVTYIVNIIFWCAVIVVAIVLIKKKFASNKRRAQERRNKTEDINTDERNMGNKE